jgi:hypothetical protein
MDLKNNPKAYWAFETSLLKEDVRDIISSVSCKNLRIQSPFEYTPWRINLFRIEEFEKYFGLSEQYAKLNPLRGWEGPSEESPLLSSSDMLKSYFDAQNLLKNDSNLEKFVKISKDNKLNYIIQSNLNGAIPSAAYNGSIAVLGFLTDISLELFTTQIKQESIDFRNQLYGYFENSENQEFKIIDGYEKEIQLK